MKAILSLIAMTLLTTVASAHPNNYLFGSWRAENPVYAPDLVFHLNFHFNRNATHLTVGCAFRDGAYLSATTGAAVRYYGNEIHILQHSRTQTNDGYRFCEAMLQPARWISSYDQWGRLWLTMDVPYRSNFRLVRN